MGSSENCEVKAGSYTKSPIGVIQVEYCRAGVHRLWIGGEPGGEATLGHAGLERWLDNYFDVGCVKESGLPLLCPQALALHSEFSQDVWRALAETIPGQRVSYAELGRLAGREGAARAVGSAMRTNPTPLLIPCHRVVKSDGSLGNYSGAEGPKTKQLLLDLEANE